MPQINVIERPATYVLSEDSEFLCTHEDHEVEPPCCDGRDCGCHGMYGIACNNPDCTGIADHEVDTMIEDYIEAKNDWRDYQDERY